MKGMVQAAQKIVKNPTKIPRTEPEPDVIAALRCLKRSIMPAAMSPVRMLITTAKVMLKGVRAAPITQARSRVPGRFFIT